jgi:predicted amidohydrolase
LKTLILCLIFSSVSAAALPFQLSGVTPGPDGKPAGWSTWSARPETAPRCFVDPQHSRSKAGALAISGASNLVEHGGWEHLEHDIVGGSWYRFTAYYRAEAVASENWQIVARLDWRSAQNLRSGQPDYAYRIQREGAWTRLTIDTQAPQDAAAVALQLYLSNAPDGTVWWDDVSLVQIPAPAPRELRIAAVNLRPQGTKSGAESVSRFVGLVEDSVHEKTDVILFPEGITKEGTGESFADSAEPIPGPTTLRLGELAKERNTYIVAGIYEREGPAIYNTAVLIDRLGRLAGKYRKVYLPREEIEGGLTPGRDYPVFQTDFGTVGLMICYDVQFADPARALAGRGAEIIFMPIAGGDETLAKARAIENKVFLVTSGYDFPTSVIDPDGNYLSIARDHGTVARATVDLNHRYVDSWLGEMHSRRMRELRLDIPPRQPGLGN